MIGLIFLALAIGWFFVAFWITKRLTQGLKTSSLRIPLGLLLVVVIVALPVADEIIGGFQFRALCRENAVLKIDAEKIKGRAVYMVSDPENKVVENTSVKIYLTRVSYRDVATNEELASNGYLVAMGGKLLYALAGGHEVTPMTIFPSTCSGPGNLPTSKMYEFKINKKPEGTMQ